MDFQVVVLAGGFSKTLVPLVSKEVPKALLPVANRPVLSYVLELLEQNDLKNAIVVGFKLPGLQYVQALHMRCFAKSR